MTGGRLSALALVVLLGACTAGPERREPAPVAAPPRPSTPETPTAAPDDAVAGLLAEARAARAAGALERALALLERAQRLAPARAAVYLQLARTHAAAGDRSQARAFAERGLLYCRGDACRPLARLAR